MAVVPGFINVLSWATESLLVDGQGQSDIRQGVTLEVFGEGWSMGPLNAAMRRDAVQQQSDLKFDVPWTTLSEYLDHMVARCIAERRIFRGRDDRPHSRLGIRGSAPTASELERMKESARKEMEAAPSASVLL